MLIEPRAFKIEQRNAGQVRERERVDRQLRERLVRGGVGLVVEKMHGAVPDLEEVDVAGNDAFVTRGLRGEANPPSGLDGDDVGLVEPYRYLDGDGDGIVCEHKSLKRLVPQLVIAYRRNDERSGFGRSILPDIDDRVRGIGERRFGLRGAGFGVPFPVEKFVRTIGGDVFEKIGKRREARVALAFVVEHAGAEEVELRTVVGETINLAVVQLDGADRLGREKAGEALRAEPAIAAMALVLLQPRRDRRGRNSAVGLLLETGSGFFEREAEVEVGES